jgi:hypothetical protein
MAIRASANRSTGFTPSMLMLGMQVNTPAQLMFPSANAEAPEEYGEYISNLLQTIQKTHITSRNTLKTSMKCMKRDYDLRVLYRPYSEGDVVYLKLCPPWKGPAIITKKLTSILYSHQT